MSKEDVEQVRPFGQQTKMSNNWNRRYQITEKIKSGSAFR